MSSRLREQESELQRKSQELAVAWRKGCSAYVLDCLSAEPPLRAALIATLVYEVLARWDPYDCKWPKSFWRALLARSLGLVTVDELAELEAAYRRRFGSSPPYAGPDAAAVRSPMDNPDAVARQAHRIRHALATDTRLQRSRSDPPSMFLRSQPLRQA